MPISVSQEFLQSVTNDSFEIAQLLFFLFGFLRICITGTVS